MIAPGVVKAGACVTLIMLAGSDLRMRRLPNVAVAAFVALYFVNAAMTGFGRASWDIHLAAGGASLAVAALMFRLGWLGGAMRSSPPRSFYGRGRNPGRCWWSFRCADCLLPSQCSQWPACREFPPSRV